MRYCVVRLRAYARGAGSLILLLGVLLAPAPAAGAKAASLNLNQPLSIGAAHTHPGVRTPAPSTGALAATLSDATGLAPSQVAAENVCPAPTPGTAACDAQRLVLRSNHHLVRPHVGGRESFSQVFPSHREGIAPATSGTSVVPPQTSTPAWLQQAYDLTYLSQTGGVGDTVAIVDAYDDPGAESDLATYRSRYGLPACTTANGCFSKLNQNGQTSPLPARDSGWESEESLDLDAVSALCPNCHIMLVEANSNSLADLDQAVIEAAAKGAQQISNSWSANATGPIGGTFTFPGVAVVAATGDHGYIPQTFGSGADAYPAAYPGVTAAGGTSLAPATDGHTARGFAESAWSLSGGWGASSGCDTLEPKPAYQTDRGCTGRAYADLSADADPSTGLVIYDSGNGGWLLAGGTSLASPLIAAYYAVTGVNAVSPGWGYGVSSLLNDPASGSSGSCPSNIAYICNAGTGYDGPTGIGSISGGVVSGAPGIGGPAIPSGSGTTYVQTAGANAAALLGGVYPNGLDTTYSWQYGTTTAYGQQTPATDVGSGKTATGAAGTLTGLSPSTVYHYRLVAQNSAGTSYGYDYSLTTAPSGSLPPANTTLPTVTGTPQQGQTLTASQGTWSPTPTGYSYQWQRSTDGDATWTNIAGATAATYVPVSADVGADVRVVVNAANSFGSTGATTASVGPVTSGAPLNTSPPSISGNPHAGQILNVNSSWNPAGASYTYQWQRSTDGGTTWTNIAGATGASYTLAVADENGVVRATVTATNAYGQSSVTSTPVGPVLSDPPVNTVAPVVTGSTQRTYTLTATQGTWNGHGNTYAYQWQRSADGTTWSNVSGANASSYTLAPADEGDLMRVLVTASNIDGFVSSASAPTLPVSPFPPANTIAPAISGTAVRASILTATQGTWTGPGNAYSYQWQRDFGEGYVDITGATTTTYALTYADEGATVRVVVTATNPDGTIVQASQPTTTVMSAIPVNQARPSVTGTMLRGSPLIASIGIWSGVGNVYSYQWQRSTDGNTWTDIAGATGTGYTLTLADEGYAMRVFVTASNSDGAAGVASAPTAPIPTAPPVNTTAPSISGTVQRSGTLTGAQGSWNGLGNAYSYQWQRSADGTTWTNIAGATAQSYTVAVADEHYAIRFAVTATNPDATVTAASQPTAVIQSAPPVNTIAPSTSGNAQRASVLTAALGSWNGVGNTYTYHWQRSADGIAWTNIAGATLQAYTVGVGDEGSAVRVAITVSNLDGSVTVATLPTTTVPAAPPVNLSLPTIVGTVQRGVQLTADQGTWGGIANSYSYQWQHANGAGGWANIAGATDPTYALATSDDGRQMRVLVTATNEDATATAASAATVTVPSSPPVNTSAPTIAGTAQRGLTLTSTQGAWNGNSNGYAYQWQRSPDGSSWSDIGGAIGQTYTPALADEGDVIRLEVTASNPDGSATATSTASAVVTDSVPANTSLPAVTGTALRGATMTGTQGVWSGNGNAYTYQWQHDSGFGFSNIGGATGLSYTLGVSDEGSRLRLVVTATNPDGVTAVASAATATVAGIPAVNTTAPAIAGVAQRGVTLSSTQGAWTGLGNTYTYQWQRSTDGTTWTNIAGATNAAYTLALGDEGAVVRMLVIAANPDGNVSAASNATATVSGSPPVNTTVPSVAGAAQRGSTLASNTGVWNGAGNAYAYQWQRSADGTTWTDIGGATAPTYVLTPADEHNVVRLSVTASNADGIAAAVSIPTATVPSAPPVATAPPAIAGTATRALTLTSTQGTWSGIGNSYSYQWQHDTGSGFADIAGATGAAYKLDVGDEGSRLRLVVTATNADGTAIATAAPTATVQADSPVDNTAPAIVSGVPLRTSTLIATQGSWTGAGNTYAFQWQRSTDGGRSWTSVAGATNPAYLLGTADEGANVRVLVTATNPDGSLSVPSPATPTVQASVPVNTVKPTVTGSARIGATLAAVTGNWTPDVATFGYDWQRGNATHPFQDIAGATTANYTVTAADIGYSIRVIIAATNVDGTTSTPSTPTATAIVPPPANVTAPVAPIGTLIDGSTLTPDSGTWDSGASYSYTWFRCPAGATSVDGSCTNLGTSPAYTLQTNDIGHPMAVVVTAIGQGGSTSITSPLTSAVAGRVLSSTTPPSIVGSPQVPNTLTASSGSWSVALTSISYDWMRCDADGTSNCTQAATNVPQYTLSATDRGHTIILVATATSPGRTATAQSAPVTVQDQPLPQSTAPPIVTGTAIRTSTLQASRGSWSNNPTSFAYQWERCTAGTGVCQAIAGATASSYVLTRGDEGSAMTVQVTAGNTSGTGTATAHATTPVAQLLPVNTHQPVVQGTAVQQGGQVGVTAVTWNATPDTTFTTAWERCDTSGGSCQVINGATGTLYTPLAADVGHTLVAIVTATNLDGPVSSASAHSAVVLPAAPRWRALPVLSAANAQVGTALSITAGTWSGPALDTDAVQVMRCTNTCTPITSSASYTIAAADTGAVLRLRETASNAGGTTAVWSAQYVGPVTSAASGSVVLAGGQSVLRNSNGDALAIAQLQTIAITSDLGLRAALMHGRLAKPTRARRIKVHRARGARGKLRVWACPLATKRGQAPPPCTHQVTLNNKTVTLKLPAVTTGKVRVVVVRRGR